MEVIEFDYSGCDVHFENLDGKCEEIKNRVAALKPDTLFKLNLSNNYLDDACAETLLSALSDETANMHHLAILDLTNNHITRRGLLTLAPLFIRNDFKWLVVPANDFGVKGVLSFFSDLEPMARKAPREIGGDRQQLLDYWISKVIWVPETFTEDIHRLPITISSMNSHLKYYGKLSDVHDGLS